MKLIQIQTEQRGRKPSKTLFFNTKGQLVLSGSAAEEFMISPENYKDYGFIFHKDLEGKHYIERIQLSRCASALPLNKNGNAFRFYSQLITHEFQGYIEPGQKSHKLTIRFDKLVHFEGKIVYPLEK